MSARRTEVLTRVLSLCAALAVVTTSCGREGGAARRVARSLGSSRGAVNADARLSRLKTSPTRVPRAIDGHLVDARSAVALERRQEEVPCPDGSS
jgi:hypothetical protein